MSVLIFQNKERHITGASQLGTEYIASVKCIRTQKQQEPIPWHHVNCQNCVKVCEFDASTKPNIFQYD